MNILLIHQSFVSPQESGGTRHYELARHLLQQNHRCTIVAGGVSYLTGRPVGVQQGIVSEDHIDGIRILRAYTLPTLHRSFFWRVISFLSFMTTSIIAAWKAGPVDLVISTSPPIFQVFSGWVIACIRRRPFLLEIRDLWPAFAIDMGVLRNPVLITLSRWLERFLYRRATHFLVNSPAYRDYLFEKGIPAEKISFIANGVDPDMFDPDADGHETRHRLQLQDKFIVTYAGALGLANDIGTLLRAAERLRCESSLHFLLIGDGKERMNLEAQAQSMGLTNVTFTGPVPKTAVPEALAATDVCVAILQNIPMFRTTYPNKVFDYMAAGRPTLLAIDGVIREVIETSGGGIFVTPGNDEQLAAAIQYCYKHPCMVRMMGKSARDYVVRYFNRHQQAALFASLIIDITRPTR